MDFPRQTDKAGYAWGLAGSSPKHEWERFSADYERNLERLVRALEAQGFAVHIDGAGSEDGEYVCADHPDGTTIFRHLEDPKYARELNRVSDADFRNWLDKQLKRAGSAEA